MTRFTGTMTLVRLALRRDRVVLPVWLLSLTGLIYSSVAAVQGLYDTAASQATYQATIGGSAASIALSGPPVALGTIGGITVFEVSQVAIIGIALMAMFLTVRHTRADEEAGRTELVRAGVLGRQADLLAAGILACAASLLVGASVVVSFLSVDLAAADSLVFGGAVASVGLVFTGVALVAAQVVEHGRQAVGLALTALGVAFVLRAVGDVADNGLRWASPLGWAQGVHAFAGPRWWPLGLCLTFAVALAAAAGWLTPRRDLGGGLVAARPGPPAASPRLGSAWGLALRLQRGMLLGWTVGMTLLGVMFGSVAAEVDDMVAGNSAMQDVFARSGVDIVDAYAVTVLLILALVTTGFTLGSVLRLRAEETTHRVEPLLSTPTSRTRWAAGWLLVSASGTLAVLTAAGLGAGVTSAVVLSDPGRIEDMVGGALVYLPAVLLVGGLAFALFGGVPALLSGVWLLLAGFFVAGWLGELLSLPAWLVDLSPYSHAPQVPLEPLSWAPLLTMTGVAALCVAAGFVSLRQRDLATG